MLIISGYIATVVVLIIAVTLTRDYMRNRRKEVVNRTTPSIHDRSFISNHMGLFILVLTPILFGIAWFIGWMLSR